MDVEPTMENIRLVSDSCLDFAEWREELKLEDSGTINRPFKALHNLYISYFKFNKSSFARKVRRLSKFEYSANEIYDKLNKRR